MMFLNCPAYLDQDRAVRCGLPAEVRCRFTMRSTDGPLESVMIRCPIGHHFSAPIEFLTPDSTDNHDPGASGLGSRAGRDSLQRGHEGRHGDGGSAPRISPPSRSGKAAPEHRSRLLPGPPCRPVDHRHAPAPQAHRSPLPDGSRRHPAITALINANTLNAWPQ